MHRYDDHPCIAVWEITRASDIRCGRCREAPQPDLDPLEIDTSGARRVLAGLATAGVPEVMLTGRDPAKRLDLVELVRFGRSLDLLMQVALEPTPLVTPALLAELAEAGLSSLAIGIDGQGVVTHDGFRGVAGSFEGSLRVLGAARRLGLATQVNTMVHAGSVGQLERIADLVGRVGSRVWNVAYLVPTDPVRARLLPRPEAAAASLDLLLSLAHDRPFAIRTTAAPDYPRHVSARRGRAVLNRGRGVQRDDERGFVFISHQGDIFPGGSLPVHCGNVKTDDLLDVYRHHLVFRMLRTPDMLGGKCRVCAYRSVCAGSRARAYAMSHSLMAQDPLCTYVPPDYAYEHGSAV